MWRVVSSGSVANVVELGHCSSSHGAGPANRGMAAGYCRQAVEKGRGRAVHDQVMRQDADRRRVVIVEPPRAQLADKEAQRCVGPDKAAVAAPGDEIEMDVKGGDARRQ